MIIEIIKLITVMKSLCNICQCTTCPNINGPWWTLTDKTYQLFLGLSAKLHEGGEGGGGGVAEHVVLGSQTVGSEPRIYIHGQTTQK